MRGVRVLIGGYVACVALAAPAVLSAAEDDAAIDPGTGGVAVAPATGPPSTPESPGVAAAQAEPSAKQSTHQVVMRNIAFVPKTINVGVGDTITWTNEDSEPHNAIAEDDSFRTPTIQQGETASVTIDKAGTYPYFCSIHAGMKGTVVAGGGGSSGSGSGGGSGGGSDSIGDTGSASSGKGSSGSGAFPGDLGTAPGAGTPGTSSNSPSSLPNTGRDDVLWFALAGAWLLSVGALIRAAAADRLS